MANDTQKPDPAVLRDKYKPPAEILQQSQITLRRWQIQDAEALHAAAAASLPELKPWMPWAKNGYTLDDAKSFLTMTTGDWESGKEYNWALVVDEKAVGSFGLMDPMVGGTGMGLGYWIATPVTGRGLATRAADLLTKTAFELGAELVQIWHHVDNVRSKAIPQRLGYRFVGEKVLPPPAEEGMHGIWQLQKPEKI